MFGTQEKCCQKGGKYHYGRENGGVLNSCKRMKKLVFQYAIVLPLILQIQQPTLQGQNNMEKPRVMILTTGGTIASRAGAPLIDGPALVQAVPQLATYAQVEVEEVVRIGSSKMTPDIWVKLASRLNELAKNRPELSCLLLTHGTDTMEETAFFLDQTYKGNIPVVLVGAMRSANAVSADGPANLLDGLRTGLSPQARGKGVVVVLNNAIHAAIDLTKTDNTRVHTFIPTEKGFLGTVDEAGVRFFRTPSHPHTTDSPFLIKENTLLPTVDLVRDYAGMPPEIVGFFAERSNKGLVIETFAGGRTSTHIDQLLQTWSGEKPLVLASSLRGSRLSGDATTDQGIIVSRSLPANKARILLMLALTITSDAQDIQNMFDRF